MGDTIYMYIHTNTNATDLYVKVTFEKHYIY